MTRGLSYQQLQILKKLAQKPCEAYEFRRYYSYSNLYTALKLLMKKGLIRKEGRKYFITQKGYIVCRAWL